MKACVATALYDPVAHVQQFKRTTGRAFRIFEGEAENFGKPGKDDEDESGGGPYPVLKMTRSRLLTLISK